MAILAHRTIRFFYREEKHMGADEKITLRRIGNDRRVRFQFNENIDILFDGNKAPAHSQWRDRFLVHELAQNCIDQC